ncbi:hypothetical protein [Tardiphaga robiniae]|uniref:hypothetical protein n=1 Tax=Tardiphaga robiniae TaxID=943830 RepID=UPI001112C401|nr:hypothetical protein [Tardiphaga robiniae]
MLRILLLAFFLAGMGSRAEAQLFSIVSPRFSSFVEDDGEYTMRSPIVEPGGSIARRILTDEALYFSFGVEVTEGTLDYLTRRRHLSVRCIVYADGYSEESIEIGISPATWARQKNAITQAVRQNGSFKWRTYLNTSKIDAKVISIVIKDDFGRSVKPGGFLGSFEAKVSIEP